MIPKGCPGFAALGRETRAQPCWYTEREFVSCNSYQGQPQVSSQTPAESGRSKMPSEWVKAFELGDLDRFCLFVVCIPISVGIRSFSLYIYRLYIYTYLLTKKLCCSSDLLDQPYFSDFLGSGLLSALFYFPSDNGCISRNYLVPRTERDHRSANHSGEKNMAPNRSRYGFLDWDKEGSDRSRSNYIRLKTDACPLENFRSSQNRSI